jgi:hypothetical protein
LVPESSRGAHAVISPIATAPDGPCAGSAVAAANVIPITPPGSPVVADERSQELPEVDASPGYEGVLVHGRYLSTPPLHGVGDRQHNAESGAHGTHALIDVDIEDPGLISERSTQPTAPCSPGRNARSASLHGGRLSSRAFRQDAWQPEQLVCYIWAQLSSRTHDGELERSSRIKADPSSELHATAKCSEQDVTPSIIPSGLRSATDFSEQNTTPSAVSASSSALGTPLRRGQWVVGRQQVPAGGDVLRAVQRRTFIDIDVCSTPPQDTRKSRSMSPLRLAAADVSVNAAGGDEGEPWYFCWHY